MNKEQTKHVADLIKELAVGQFMFFGGKSLYLFAKNVDYDVDLLVVSGLVYFACHAIIHIILSELED